VLWTFLFAGGCSTHRTFQLTKKDTCEQGLTDHVINYSRTVNVIPPPPLQVKQGSYAKIALAEIYFPFFPFSRVTSSVIQIDSHSRLFKDVVSTVLCHHFRNRGFYGGYLYDQAPIRTTTLYQLSTTACRK
jgi:hypothetical protein